MGGEWHIHPAAARQNHRHSSSPNRILSELVHQRGGRFAQDTDAVGHPRINPLRAGGHRVTPAMHTFVHSRAVGGWRLRLISWLNACDMGLLRGGRTASGAWHDCCETRNADWGRGRH